MKASVFYPSVLNGPILLVLDRRFGTLSKQQLTWYWVFSYVGLSSQPAYYSNHWNAQNFPWMAQQLFNTTSSTPTKFTTYNQKFDPERRLHRQRRIAERTRAAGVDSDILDLSQHYQCRVHRWYRTLSFWKRQESCEDRVARVQENPDIDPHYKLMVRNGYKEVPSWWWAAVLITVWVAGIACLYAMKSTLPWWAFLLSTIILWIMSLFFNSISGLTGFGFNLTPISQKLAGYLFPLHPLANLYFTTSASHGCSQAGLLAKDLRIAQYAHLPPRHTFWLQISGRLIGSLMDFRTNSTF
ncbi:oligopeptide transporter like protein [Zymoseptoria brevis]|uniref:Oligopeptide transporter like protein n=1 Tax=Zymoseptoria brevis TaxID=1047168 RepID=A0A0F4G692_9PEZI|nr:oligopeptide transporter like protein [Zymoseptoria brevis]